MAARGCGPSCVSVRASGCLASGWSASCASMASRASIAVGGGAAPSATRQRRPLRISSNRHFQASGPDRLWVMDVTEHPTGEGKVYLAIVLDAWSPPVVGWSIADHLRAELVCDALDMATWRRRPPKDQTITHSDHGSQGGFDWSSQHLIHGGVVDDHAGTSAGRAALSGANSVAGSADGGLAAGPGAVLGCDRVWCQFGGRSARDRGVIGGRSALVPTRWRRESQPCPVGVGSLPVLHGTGGHCCVACTEARRARDRASARARAVDGLAGATA